MASLALFPQPLGREQKSPGRPSRFSDPLLRQVTLITLVKEATPSLMIPQPNSPGLEKQIWTKERSYVAVGY